DDRLSGQGDLHGHRGGRLFRHLFRVDQLLMSEKPESGSKREAGSRETVIRVRGLTAGFAERNVFENLDIDAFRGEILGVVGASGTGKTVLLRTILGLVPKRAGTIEIFGVDVDSANAEAREAIDRRLGVMFQMGALFSSLNVLQNVQVPMREHL